MPQSLAIALLQLLVSPRLQLGTALLRGGTAPILLEQQLNAPTSGAFNLQYLQGIRRMPYLQHICK